ncbi:hypothetical protein [Engelhardtia mirabilis]|uniref:Lipoprotein n=1 Tax=Engelhardtia mirabilis TaxID=2528011 RepID=A0A518BG55_9BACT|nr:hypothetical protein Pla133_10120 [Planctomycetes bacterium Pla133]QDV00272.1 hypothetical protein Pla86_10110 [Planctomycetes bacterium Pla86]
MNFDRITALGLVLALGLAGCGDHAHHEGDGHDHSSEGGGHTHAAPHGGLLVELGDHEANVELLLDAEAGTLTLFALGAHAEQPVRLSAAGIDLTLELPEGPVQFTLAPVAHGVTGETVGDTSEFKVQDPRLVGLTGLVGSLPAIEVRGARYTDLSFGGAR